MNQRTKRGFTLIELLAVIVILAIIALIAVPVIMNIINKANKSAFKDSAYGVIKAGELYFAEQVLEPNGIVEDVTMQLPDVRLQLKGEVPEGSVLITKEGKIAIAVHNNRYCVTKGLDDNDVTITEDYESCENPGLPKTLTDLVTTSAEVTSIPACVTNKTECNPGTLVAIQVNASEVYNFYVIDETDNEVTLIMDRNIYEAGSTTDINVAWINAEDYEEANADDNTSCDATSCNDEGPITALSALKERTSSWTNIPERVYTYSDDGGGNKYENFIDISRARLMTQSEINDFGCDDTPSEGTSCPYMFYRNLVMTGDDNVYGYWLSTANSSNGVSAFALTSYGTFAGVSGQYVYEYSTTSPYKYGIRPVITLTK